MIGDEMMKTKLAITLTTLVTLGILTTGLVLAHNPYPPTPIYPNYRYVPDTGYYSGGCYGYDPYYRYPPPTQEPDTTEEPQTPLPPQEPTKPRDYYPPSPNRGYYYPNSYGRGCWGWYNTIFLH
jgi:hypothetical protein